MGDSYLKCPNCSNDLSPWSWCDGGHKGIECLNCKSQWWSNEIADKFHKAEEAAVQSVLLNSEFPSDAESDIERNAFLASKYGVK